ncbi:restriction endonuclease subunit S [Leuconostoc lactis]|nr:restriction endonuclease subunit S [Leuconostoc lactis]
MSEMVPKIRFQGFTDAWERRKLDDVLTERNIQQPQTSEYPLVSFTVEKGVTPKTERYEREQLVVGDTKSKKYKITEFNDIVYNPANLKFGAISRNSYGKAVFSPIYVTFVVDEQIAYPKFMEMFVTRPDFIQHALKYQQGTVYERQSVSPENLLSMNLLLPIKDEQSQIGLFFQKFDDIINFHQRKLDLLKEQKKGFLQKMFPKDGQIVPEIRFAGFTDDWEQCKLRDIVDIYDGTHQTPKYTSAGVKFVSVENISNLETEKYISQEAYEKEYANKQTSKGDVLMTRIGDIGTARVVETTEPLAYYVTLSLLKPKLVESDFLAWLITSPAVQHNIWKRTLHIAFPKKINLGEINQVETTIPKKTEQEKIGIFFKQLDDLITLHQRKVNILKEQKKGFLQKMFVS